MKKVIFLIMACFMVLGATSMSYGQSSRLNSMNAAGWQVDDQSNIFAFPNTGTLYSNILGVNFDDLSSSNKKWGGLTKSSDIGTLGVFVNRPGVAPFRGTISQNWDQPVICKDLVDVLWAKAMDAITFGLLVNYGERQRYIANGSMDTRVLGAMAGLATELAPFNSANFRAYYSFATKNNWSTDSDETIKDDGIFNVGFGTLLISNFDADNSMRLFGDLDFDQCAATTATTVEEDDADVASTSKYNNSTTNATLGLAFNHKVNNGKGLVYSGFTLGWWGATNKDTSTSGDDTTTTTANANMWDISWNAGVEGQMTSWLNWRAGLGKSIFHRYFQRDAENTAASYGDENSQPFIFTCGFGVALENWVLDCDVNSSSLLTFAKSVKPGQGLFTDGEYFQIASMRLSYLLGQ